MVWLGEFMTQRAIRGEYLYFVTANVQNRRWFFVTPERAEKLGQAIRTCSKLKQFDLLAYCILPNHVHLLVRKLSFEEVKQRLGDITSSQRTLENMRCEELKNVVTDKHPSPQRGSMSPPHHIRDVLCGQKHGNIPADMFLFPHRRLSSRRYGLDEQHTLSDLMKSIKGTFSRTLPRGKFWQHRSFVRIVGAEGYLYNIVSYIQYNYRKMELNENYGRAPFVFVDWDVVQRAVG